MHVPKSRWDDPRWNDSRWEDFNWNIPPTIYSCTATLSVLGSTWIIFEFLRDRNRRAMCYHRIIFALSLFDLLTSTWFCINTLAQSNDRPVSFQQKGLLHGNHVTCGMSGFSIYLGSLAIPWYNASLSAYYYLAACRQWEEEQIRKKFERFVHLIIVSFAMSLAIIPIFLDLYNPDYSFCYVVFSPERVQSQGQNDKADLYDVFQANIKQNMYGYIFELVAMIGMLISTCVLATMLILINNLPTEPGMWSDTDDDLDEDTSANNQKAKEHISTALSMSFLYSVTFFLAWTMPFSWMLLVLLHFQEGLNFISDYPIVHFIGQIYLAIFLPSQGFMNWVVYLRPRFKKIRKRQTSYFITMRDVLFWSCRRRPAAERYDGDCYLGSCMEDDLQNCTSYISGGIQMSSLENGLENEDVDFSISSGCRPATSITGDAYADDDGTVSDLSSVGPPRTYVVDGISAMTTTFRVEEKYNHDKEWTKEEETIKDVEESGDRNRSRDEFSSSEFKT